MVINSSFAHGFARRDEARRAPWALDSGFGPEALRDAARISNGDPIPRRLVLHVHLPSGAPQCAACGPRVVEGRDEADPVADGRRLLREIDLVAALFDADRRVLQLQLAGVDPARGAARAQLAVLARLKAAFRIDRSAQIEAIVGASDAGLDGLPALVRAGVNRLCLVGDNALALAAALRRCAALPLRDLAVDLGCGGAGAEGLATLLLLRPGRVGLHPMAQPAALDALAVAGEQLQAAGYVHLGSDQFVRPDDPLALAQARSGLRANLLGYTEHADTEVVGIGIAALSQVGDSLSLNCRSPAAWRRALDAGLLPVARGRRLGADDASRSALAERGI